MKKLTIITTFIFTTNLMFGQLYNKIDTSFYSEILEKDVLVDIYFPPGYDENPQLFYPVIYYLHGWYGNQNTVSGMYSWTQSLINNGTIDPVILVGANNNVEPFYGSCYLNSIIWGNYEDMMVEDLPNWIENSFRVIPDKNARALMGQSMGGFGSFWYGLNYPERYCAFAAHAAEINFDLFMDDVHLEVQAENSGPSYAYDFETGGFFTQWMFLVGGGVTPNYNTPQTYINPAIIEFPFDDNCEVIDTIIEKWSNNDILPLLHNFPQNETIGIFYSCGENDGLHIYPANLALTDTLDNLGFPYEFYSHDGDHSMPGTFRQKALLFIDSLMMGPLTGVELPLEKQNNFEFMVYPNPYNSLSRISFSLHVQSNVNLKIIDTKGRLIQSKPLGLLQSGDYRIPISISDLPEGIYFCHLQVENEMITKKIIKL